MGADISLFKINFFVCK